MAFGIGMGAVSLGSIFVAINANLTGLVSGTQLAKAKLGHFQRQVATVSPQLQRLGMTATVAGGAIVAMAALSVRAFAQFEQEMANVGSVLGEHFKDMVSMREVAREWGQTTIFSARETGQAMYYLASAGYNAEQTVEALGATLTLAGATMNDLSQTTQMVVAAMNAFALGTENADRVANSYAAAISKSQATAARLAISMRYVAPIAHNAGQEFETVVAALGLLYNSGMEASMAGTALRMSFVRLARLTPMARKEIENLGIAAQDVDPTLHSLVDIIRQFEEHKITPRAASVIFGARALAGVLNLVTAGADRLDEMTKSITDTNKAYDMLDIQTDTFLKTLTLLKNAITEIVMQFGEGLLPVLREVAEGTREVALAVGDMNPALKRVASVVTTAGGASLLLAGIIGMIAAAWPKVVAGFKIMAGAVKLLAGPYGVILALGAALVGVFWKVGQATREANKGVLDTIDADKSAIKSGAAKIAKLQELTETYDELTAKENKTAAEMRRLQRVMEDIRDLQPSLIKGVDEFGKVIDLDRERVSAYTDELIREHNMRREASLATWTAEKKTLDERAKTEAEVYNESLDRVKAMRATLTEDQAAWEEHAAAHEEFHRQKSDAAGIGFDDLSKTAADGVAAESQAVDQIRALGEDLALEKAKWKEPAILAEPGPPAPGKSPVDQVEEAEAATGKLLDTLLETNRAAGVLKDGLRSLDPSALKDVALGISGEQVMAITKDQEDAEARVQALKLANITEQFDQEEEEATRAHDKDMALADTLAAHRESLGEKVANYEQAMARETDDEKKDDIQKSMDRELGMIAELAADEEVLRTQAAERFDLAKADIERRRNEQTLTDAKSYLDRLKALRIAAEIGDYAQARAATEAQYAEDLELAKDAGDRRTEMEVLAALVRGQRLASIRKDELEDEIATERRKNRMSLSEYSDYLAERLALSQEGSEDYLALQAEIAEVEAEINEQRRQDWERFGSSIANSLSNATVDWLNALRRSAGEAEQIWTDLGQHIKDAIIKKALDPLTNALTQAIAVMMEEIGKLIYRLLFAKALAWMLSLIPGGEAAAGGGGGYVIPVGDPIIQSGGRIEETGRAVVHRDERVLSPKLTDLVESMAEAPFPGAGFGRGTSPAELATAARAVAAPRAPWTEMGMSAADFFTLAAIEHVDPIIVAPGAMLSIDEDSVDDFLERTLIPAKRRYAQRLRDVVGEVID